MPNYSYQESLHLIIFGKLRKTIVRNRLIPLNHRGKSSSTSHPFRFLFLALQMLTNVPTAHMIVTSMPTVSKLWDPTYVRANQHISETENTAQASVSF